MTHVLDAQGRVKRGFSGGGLQLAEIWEKANMVETAIGVAGVFVQVTIFTNNGQSNGATPDHTQDHITINTDGIYLIIASFCVESIGGAADLVAMDIRTNNGTVTLDNIFHHRKLAGGGGDVGSMALSGLANLSAGDTVEVWATNEDNATNILVCHANLVVILL